jgi:hypothetical protein
MTVDPISVGAANTGNALTSPSAADRLREPLLYPLSYGGPAGG